MKRRLLAVLAAALVAGCGSDDDAGEDRVETDSQAADLAVFESARIPFTFEHPKDLVAHRRPHQQILAQVSRERGSQLNAIKVRRTAARELAPERYLDEFQRDFERTVGPVEQREERIGELEMGVLEFEDSIERRGESVAFTSVSYFFAGGGGTWQVECIADSEHRAEIESACRTALESVAF